MSKDLTHISAFQPGKPREAGPEDVRHGHGLVDQAEGASPRLAAPEPARSARRKGLRVRRAAVIALALGQLLVIAPAQAVSGAKPVNAGQKEYRTSLTRWRAAEGDFASWALAGTTLTAGGALTLDPGSATPGADPFGPGGYLGGTYYNGGAFLVGQATSPVTATPDGFSEAIASWSADTPGGTWIETLIRARVDGGRFTKYYNLGIWASDSSTVARHSVRRQGDADGFVAVDTLVLDSKLRGEAYELTFRLFSEDPVVAVPTLRSASLALSSGYNKVGAFEPGDPTLWGTVLAVPECSQMVYADGGSVWCSPTSTSMVLKYWSGDTGPCEPAVRAAVDGVDDWVYGGKGNWPFNTAYAATHGLEAEVARFESIADAEAWVAAGIPVVISYYWHEGDLTGAPIPSSDGHLAVLVGFDAAGNPIVNDPAAAADAQVQRTYLRDELEHLWVKKSGGTAYLIYPTGHPVPQIP